MKRIPTIAFVILSICLAASAFASEGHFYGVVETFGGGELVVRTMHHSTGTWRVGPHTRIEGSIERFDWVSVELGDGGHVRVLRFEERPTDHAGVVEHVHHHELTVHSGNRKETWNVTDATLGETHVEVGDAIWVKMYRNHNLAEIVIHRHDVR
jgi:hypothetical protein